MGQSMRPGFMLLLLLLLLMVVVVVVVVLDYFKRIVL